MKLIFYNKISVNKRVSLFLFRISFLLTPHKLLLKVGTPEPVGLTSRYIHLTSLKSRSLKVKYVTVQKKINSNLVSSLHFC